MSASSPVLHVAEPPANYLVRPPLVVDCSVLSAILFSEETRDDALRQLASKQLHAPSLLDHEIVSVALKKARTGWPADSIAAALANYVDQDIELHDTQPLGQHELASRYGLSAYDAAYLWLAASLRAPLATFDERLGTAARDHLSRLA